MADDEEWEDLVNRMGGEDDPSVFQQPLPDDTPPPQNEAPPAEDAAPEMADLNTSFGEMAVDEAAGADADAAGGGGPDIQMPETQAVGDAPPPLVQGIIRAPVVPTGDPDDLLAYEQKLPNRRGKGDTHIPWQEYVDMRESFSRYAGFLVPAGLWVQQTPDGGVQLMTKDHAKIVWDTLWTLGLNGLVGVAGGRLSFFEYYLCDSYKRLILEIDPSRYGEADLPSTVLAPQRIFAGQRVKLETIPVDKQTRILTRWLSIVDALCSVDRAAVVAPGEKVPNVDDADYVLDYLAHMIQHPFEKPDTCIVIYGVKGLGKDFLLSQITKYVVGHVHCASYDRMAQMFDHYDVARLNCTLIHAQEVTPDETRKYYSTLQSMITADTLTVNPKGAKAISYKNCHRMILTTNHPSCVSRADEERRYFQVTASTKFKGQFDFWSETDKLLNNAEGGAVVYNYLKTRNIDGPPSPFNPRRFPQSEVADGLQDADVSPELQWLAWWTTTNESTEWWTPMNLYASYTSFCVSKLSLDPKTLKDSGNLCIAMLGCASRGVFIERQKGSKKNLFKRRGDLPQPAAGAAEGAGGGGFMA